MEQLIFDLNSPANQSSPKRIQEIQRRIQQLQRDRSAWQISLEFLQHNDATIRFYGALTLTIKINTDCLVTLLDFSTDVIRDNDRVGENESMRAYLLEGLLSAYVRLSVFKDVKFVMQKLCSTLVTFFLKPDCGWDFPIRHVLACVLSKRYLPFDGDLSMPDILAASTNASIQSLLSAARFVVTLMEDATSRAVTSTENSLLVRRIDDNCADAFHFLKFCLSGFSQQILHHSVNPDNSVPLYSSGPESEYLELATLCISAVPYWSSSWKSYGHYAAKDLYQRTTSIVVDTVAVVLVCHEHQQLIGTTLQTLIALQQSIPRLITRANPHFPNSFVISPATQTLVTNLLQGDFEGDITLLADLLGALMESADVTSSKYITSGRYTSILQVLQALLKCQGIAVLEDSVCQVALEAISQVAEGYTDWNGDDDAKDYLKAFVQEACESCLSKTKLPFQELFGETQTWDVDDRAKFQDFRYDVHDFFQSAFGILGSTLIEAIAGTVVGLTDSDDWVSFEASMFALTAFSDTMSSDTEEYDNLLTAVLSSRHWQVVMVSSTEVPDKVRQTCIKFIAEITAYVERHSHNLVTILNFLFTSLHLPASAGSASRAIFVLCDTQRSILTEALENFLGSLKTLSDLGDSDQNRIYGAVAAIIQALPTEASKVRPLSTVLSQVLPAVSGEINGEDAETAIVVRSTSVLLTIAAIGKGLRTPADMPIDLEAAESSQSSFWMTGPGSMVQQQVLEVYHGALELSNKSPSNDLIEAACDFIRSGLTESHPSPFKFSASVAVDLISAQISLDCANIDAVLSTASGLLSSISPVAVEQVLPALLVPVLRSSQQILSGFQQMRIIEEGSFPSAALNFMARVVNKHGSILFQLSESPQLMSVIIELALVVIAESDTLPRRSASAFFAALADSSRPNNTQFSNQARDNVKAVTSTYCPRIIAALLRLVCGDCARSEIEVIAEPLKRYIANQPVLTKNISRAAMNNESGILTAKALSATTKEQRNRFVAQLESLRGSRKTNDVVKEFWISCRGSSFGYVA